jgi:hypothetical protein
MSKRWLVPCVGVVCFLLGALLAPHLPFGLAQDTPKAKDPTCLHGMNLGARNSKEVKFSKDTKYYGVDVYKDENNGNLIYISETGSIAVVPGK